MQDKNVIGSCQLLEIEQTGVTQALNYPHHTRMKLWLDHLRPTQINFKEKITNPEQSTRTFIF